MSVNRKRAEITDEDFMAVAQRQGLNGSSAKRLVRTVREVIANWRDYATRAGVHREQDDLIARLIT